MAIVKPPLNFYRRVTKSLKRVLEPIYTGPFDRASTFINAIVTNETNKNRTTTLSLSSLTTDDNLLPKSENTTILSNLTLEPQEYYNILPSKLVIQEGDSLMGIADINDLATINDSGLFWLYDIPTDITETNIQLDITSPTEIDVNWGALDYRIRIKNENFTDWTNVSGVGFISGGPIPEGPEFWSSHARVPVSNNVTGTYTLSRQNTTNTELLNFNASYYLRLAIDGDFGTLPVYELSAVGFSSPLAIQNGQIRPLEGFLGKQVTLKFWARASQNTKIISEAQIHAPTSGNVNDTDSNGLWTPVFWKVFELTPAWQQFTHTYTLPTYEQVARASYSPSEPTPLNPVYTSLTATNSLPPLSSWWTQVDLKLFWNYYDWVRHGNHPTRPLHPGFQEPMPYETYVNAVSTVLENGYYDLAAVSYTLGDGTGNFTTELSSGTQTASFVYDPILDTDTNITLSILEAVNTQ